MEDITILKEGMVLNVSSADEPNKYTVKMYNAKKGALEQVVHEVTISRQSLRKFAAAITREISKDVTSGPPLRVRRYDETIPDDGDGHSGNVDGSDSELCRDAPTFRRVFDQLPAGG